MQKFTGSPSEWNSLIEQLPNPHLLQTWEWSQVKEKFGWEPMPLVWCSKPCEGASPSQEYKPLAAGMVLKRRIPIGGLAARLCILYCPKGPLLDWSDESLCHRVLDDLQALAKKQGAIFIKIDPDVVLGTGVPTTKVARTDAIGQIVIAELAARGWKDSSDQIQFKNTVLINLSPSEGVLLERMKQKTRYNVRLAEKKGVTVRTGSLADLPTLYKMYAETSIRDGFVIRNEDYYQTVWRTFIPQSESSIEYSKSSRPFAEPLIAYVNESAIAAIFIFFFADRAYYIYGMSGSAHREKMPNHLLQWEALRRAKAYGCSLYDLWGAPDDFSESDPMWNVFRFKQGLGGEVVRTMGAWDFAPTVLWYKMYSEVIPRLLDVMRSRSKAQTRQALGA